MKLKKILLFGLLTSLSMKGFAMLPVVDVGAISNLIKSYNQLKNQYDLLRQTYQNAKQQLDQVKQLTQDAEGHYGFGRLFNGEQDFNQQTWSPDNWKNALQGLAGGNPARYQELVNAYQQNHPVLAASNYEKGASHDQAQVYSQDIEVNRAAMVNATYAFDNIKTHLETIYQLSQRIDQAQNTKAAVDLNSRLLAEVAYIQAQNLKMQILMNQLCLLENMQDLLELSYPHNFELFLQMNRQDNSSLFYVMQSQRYLYHWSHLVLFDNIPKLLLFFRCYQAQCPY